MVAIRREHPEKQVRDMHLSVITENWDILAVEAYRNFLAYGRGLLAIDEADFLDKPYGLVKFHMAFLAVGTAEFDKVVGPHEMTWFQKGKLYNPEVAMCVTFLRADQGVSSYNVQGFGSRTPKALYERSQKP